MARLTVQQALQTAIEHHRAGQLPQAEALYREILAQEPDHVDALHLLGVIAYQLGRLDLAVELIRRAIAVNPGYAAPYSNLGNALRDKGQLDEAIAAYRQAIALNPNYTDAYNNLGNALRDRALLDDAIAAYRQAIALSPDYPEAHNNLGIALKDKGQLDEAIDAYHRAISLKPGYADAYSNLADVLREMGQLDEAIAAYRQAIAVNPAFRDAHNNLGNALKDQGRLDEAIDAYRQSIALKPDLHEAHSNLLYIIHYHPDYDAQRIAEEQRRWSRQYARPLRQNVHHSNESNPERRLRIGYVSPDLRNHVVGRNLLPLFCQANRRQFEVVCYAQVLRPDVITEQFQQHADRWRNIVGMPDEQVAALVRQDQIDILVDLALHMSGNRLLVFARKPAPVQVTFAGYPASTGLDAIDYRLSDPYLDPPGIDESVYSEQTIRLPHSFWCYDPLESRIIPVNSLPALQNGFVTFGCLNNFCKINERVLALWARIMGEVEHSRLIMLSKQGSHRQRTLDFLSRTGVSPDRVEFVSQQPRQMYMELYHRIDLGLDTFPYNGHTTSLDSYWMGVPVITLVGQTAVSRAGWCQLSNLGLPELVGKTPEEFVSIAVGLANDLPRLQALRQTHRQRMEQSPLMDAAGFARGIDAAYRQMWRRWCAPASVVR